VFLIIVVIVIVIIIIIVVVVIIAPLAQRPTASMPFDWRVPEPETGGEDGGHIPRDLLGEEGFRLRRDRDDELAELGLRT
jgi:hypothetical protein